MSRSPAPTRARCSSKARRIDLAGGALRDDDAVAGQGIDDLCKDQLMSMKTTFTPGHYRRRVATKMAIRLVWACRRTADTVIVRCSSV